MKHCVPGWQSALVLHAVPAAPRAARVHSLRGGAPEGGTQSTWQVCVAVHIVPVAVLCGLTGSHPGRTPPSGPPSGTPPSGTQIDGRGQRHFSLGDSADLDLLVALPWPIVQPAALAASTSKAIMPLSPLENPTDSVFKLT